MPKSDVKIRFFDEIRTGAFYVLQHHVGHNVVGHEDTVFGKPQHVPALHHPAAFYMRECRSRLPARAEGNTGEQPAVSGYPGSACGSLFFHSDYGAVRHTLFRWE